MKLRPPNFRDVSIVSVSAAGGSALTTLVALWSHAGAGDLLQMAGAFGGAVLAVIGAVYVADRDGQRQDARNRDVLIGLLEDAKRAVAELREASPAINAGDLAPQKIRGKASVVGLSLLAARDISKDLRASHAGIARANIGLTTMESVFAAADDLGSDLEVDWWRRARFTIDECEAAAELAMYFVGLSNRPFRQD